MTESRGDAGRHLAIDEALERALPAPEVPQAFRARLNAALSRAAENDLSAARERLERERREQLAELEAHYIRVRRSTLGTVIGVAFAAGAAAVIALPWLRAHLGIYTPTALAWGGISVGLGITFFEPLRSLLRRWADAV